MPDIVVTAADIDDAAAGGQIARDMVFEEVGLSSQVRLFGRIVGDIAEILRAVVMRNVIFVRDALQRGGLVRLDIIAILIPAPADRRHPVLSG